jgi:HAD superfamily hydrolase (TIGR01509 family)
MPLTLPAGDFGAYLFDCDGTIVDSMPLHYVAWSRALGDHSRHFPEELFYAWGGMRPVDIIAALNERHGLSMPIEQVDHHRESVYRALLPQLTAVPEVLAVIEEAHARIPFAVVSGGARESVTASLGVLGLLGKFEVMVCAGDYRKAKPDPEPFLLAAEKLGVAPQSCLVFEDTQLGVDAAAAAGMACVRVPQPWERRG